MNPYARFGLVSNTVSAAILVGSLATFGLPVFEAITNTAGGTGPAMWGALAGAVTVLVVFWLAMTEAIFPTLFRFNTVRKLVLGKYYVEGTWLQAEKDDDIQRMSVIDIQPDGKSFIFSGYALNQDLEIESNTLIEFSKFEWPFMTYKYRNSLSDGADGLREGVGEIQFEMNRSSARRYNGFLQYVRGMNRMKIEGSKLTSQSEVKRLRSLDGRQKIFSKYWELFFERTLRKEAPLAAAPAPSPVVTIAPVATAPAPAPQIVPVPVPQPIVEETAASAVEAETPESEPDFVERRSEVSAPAPSEDKAVIPRRRASDWRQDPPKVDAKVKAKTEAKKAAKSAPEPKVEDVFEDFDDFREDEETAEKATGTKSKTSGAAGFRSRRRR